uniref:Glycoprotein B n=1 Tax=Myotis ricketti herpesvirus 2 TaxID=1200671 RepID=I6U6Z4_9GAMA|nr:glycoprotein B [Myotis ricketti herpesvirus 2]
MSVRAKTWQRGVDLSLILIVFLIGCASNKTTTPTTPTTSSNLTPTTSVDATVTGNSTGNVTETDEEYDSTGPFKLFLPFRVCSVSLTGEIFRFPLEERCPETTDKEHNEGIALIYKTNIVPHMFNVRKYRKIVTSTTIYKGWYEDTITNQFSSSYAIPLYEINHIDHFYMCHNSIKVNENGNINTYVDRDGYNATVQLQPVDGLTTNIRRFASQPEIYATPRNFPGFYTTRTTVNCEVTDMTARSLKPFEYFVTASGNTVEMSPFLNDTTSMPASILKSPSTIQLLENYTIANYGQGLGSGENATRFFAMFGDYSLTWKATTEQNSTCQLTLWKGFSNAIQTKHAKSFHFVANDITASFTTSTTPDTNFNTTYSCIWNEISTNINKKLNEVSKTHKSNGTTQIYKTSGGLYIAWHPLVQINLLQAHADATANKTNETETSSTPTPPTTPTSSSSSSRRKREVSSTGGSQNMSSEASVAASQVQFAYDSLRNSINKVLEELSRTWCREQHREAMMWFELSKINPTSVMSAIYGKPVSAKFVGDVISVSDCIAVNQSRVSLHNSLRVQNQPNMCYSRPLVSFEFINGSETFTGQLGSRNEILLSTALVETCQENTEHYFQFGDQMHKYKNYRHDSNMSMTKIPTLNTMITLNLSLVENIDFEVIELYSRNEKRLANVLDIESMFREYNYYTQSLSGLRKDLDNTIDNNKDAIIQTFSDIVQDLGNIGKVVVNIASGVFSLFGTIVSGIISFIKNPLGGMFMILLVVGGIFIIYLLTKRTNQMYQAPIKMIYPEIEKIAHDKKVQPIDNSQLQAILLAMHQMQQETLQKEQAPKPSVMSSISQTTSDFLRKRKGYSKIPNDGQEATVV